MTLEDSSWSCSAVLRATPRYVLCNRVGQAMILGVWRQQARAYEGDTASSPHLQGCHGADLIQSPELAPSLFVDCGSALHAQTWVRSCVRSQCPVRAQCPARAQPLHLCPLSWPDSHICAHPGSGPVVREVTCPGAPPPDLTFRLPLGTVPWCIFPSQHLMMN